MNLKQLSQSVVKLRSCFIPVLLTAIEVFTGTTEPLVLVETAAMQEASARDPPNWGCVFKEGDPEELEGPGDPRKTHQAWPSVLAGSQRGFDHPTPHKDLQKLATII